MRLKSRRDKLVSAAAALSLASMATGALAYKKLAGRSVEFIPSPFPSVWTSSRVHVSPKAGIWLPVLGILITAAAAALAAGVSTSIDRNGTHREWVSNCTSAIRNLRSDNSILQEIQRRPQANTELRAKWHVLDTDVRLIVSSCGKVFQNADLAEEIEDYIHIVGILGRQLQESISPEYTFYTDSNDFCDRLNTAAESVPGPRGFLKTILWRS